VNFDFVVAKRAWSQICEESQMLSIRAGYISSQIMSAFFSSVPDQVFFYARDNILNFSSTTWIHIKGGYLAYQKH
jgi:hypothetical protein